MNSTNPSEYATQLNFVTQRLIFYGTLFIIIPGFVLNSINFIIFSRKAFLENMRFYYRVQSVFDPLNLIVWFFIYFPLVFNTDLTNHSLFACRLIYVIRRIAAQNSAWVQVIISFDRVFSTFFSAKYKQVVGAKYLWGSLVAIVVIIVSTSLINLSFFMRTNEIVVNNQTIVQQQCIVERSIGLVINVSGFLMRAILPFIFMLIANLTLIYKLFWQKSQLNKLSKKEYNFAFTIVFNNFAYLVLNLPLTAQQIYEYLPNTATAEHRALMYMILIIGSCCCCSYWAYSFFIYLKFNKTFKKELFKMKRELFNEPKLISTTEAFSKQTNQHQ
jgi:hypothetical protein